MADNEYLAANVNAPRINRINAERRISDQILRNQVQGYLERDNVGVRQWFSQGDVDSAAQLRVYRPLPLTQQARQLGGTVNGANFNGYDDEQPATEAKGLDVLTVIDQNVSIAQVNRDMISIDLLDATTLNLTQKVDRNVNGMTIAKKLEKFLNGTDDPVFLDYTSPSQQTRNDNVRALVTETNGLLDLGDPDNEIDAFPSNDRCFVINARWKPRIAIGSLFTLSDQAQEMFKRGQTSAGDSSRLIDDGFFGFLYGVEAHSASETALRLANRYLGLPDAEFKDDFIGYDSSAYGNARGVSVGNTKIIDARYGQGITIQPLVRMGAEVWYPKANAFMFQQGWTNPLAGIRSIIPGYEFKTLAPGSRIAAVIGANKTNPGLTFSVPGGTNAGYTPAFNSWFVGTDAALPGLTVTEFLKAYDNAASADKGQYNGRTAVGTTKGYVTYLAYNTGDGTFSIKTIH